MQEVLADPLFHLRQVTLKGTVRQVQPLDPYEIPAGSTCYGATCSTWRMTPPHCPSPSQGCAEYRW